MVDAFGFGMAFYLKDKASAEMEKIGKKMRDLIGDSESLGKAYEKGIKGMKIGAGMATAGAGILAGLGAMVSVSMDFNKAISEVGAITKASAEDLSRLKEQSMALGESTAFTAKQVAEGQKFLGMAGFGVKETLGAMPGLLSLAAAGNLELGRAADIASNTLSMFQLQATESNRVADVMAKTATRSNTSMEQYAEAMKYIGGTASSLGVSLEEVSAAIGILGDNGLQGSVATRVISSAMLRFSKPTSQMSKVMKDLNITMFDSQGKFKGLAGMIEEVERATIGMTDEQKTATVATLFGADAADNLLLLMNSSKRVYTENGEEILKGSKALRGFTTELQNAAGAADKMAEMQLDNLAGDFTKLESAMEGLAIRIGDKLEPALRKATQAITIMISSASEFVKSPFGDMVVKVTAALGGLLVTAGSAYTTISALKMGFTVFLPLLKAGAFAGATALAPLVAGVLAVSAAVGTAWASVSKFNEAFESYKKGNYFVFADEGALMYLQRIGGFLTGVWEILKSVNDEGFVLPKELDSALGDMGGGVKNFVIATGHWISKFRTFFVEGFKFAGEVLEPVGKAFSELWTALQPVLVELGDALGGTFGNFFKDNTGEMTSWASAGKMVFGALAGVIRLVIYPIQELAEAITEGIKFWNEYKTQIKAVGSFFWDYIIKPIWANITLPFRLMWDVGVGIVNGIQGGFSAGWDSFKTSLLQTVYDTIALLPGGKQLLSTFGFERPTMEKNKGSQGQKAPNTNAFAQTQSVAFNPFSGDVGQMQATNTATTKALSQVSSTPATAQTQLPQQPIVIQNTLTLPDGRVLTEMVNETNAKQAKRNG